MGLWLQNNVLSDSVVPTETRLQHTSRIGPCSEPTESRTKAGRGQVDSVFTTSMLSAHTESQCFPDVQLYHIIIIIIIITRMQIYLFVLSFPSSFLRSDVCLCSV